MAKAGGNYVLGFLLFCGFFSVGVRKEEKRKLERSTKKRGAKLSLNLVIQQRKDLEREQKRTKRQREERKTWRTKAGPCWAHLHLRL